MSDTMYDLIIIGAGPIGLESALYASECGLDFLLLEKKKPAAALESWGFLRMFSPLKMNISPLGAGILKVKSSGAYLTGREMKQSYFDRLAKLESISARLSAGITVKKVGRDRLLKSQLPGNHKRAEMPFLVYGIANDNSERYYRARAVIDASGVYDNPNFLGPGGLPAIGEKSQAGRIAYHLVDLASSSPRLGKKFLVVGGGHSACTMIAQIDELTKRDRDVSAVWVTAGDAFPPVQQVPDDPLRERARIVEQANRLSRGINDRITYIAGKWVEQIKSDGKDSGLSVTLVGNNGETETINTDHVLALVGYRPDRGLYEELQVHECYASSGPIKLAARLLESSSSTDCLAPVEASDDLYNNPEPNFYILGAKSYGRTTNFLIQKGHDQIKTVFKQITGKPDLDLYAEV